VLELIKYRDAFLNSYTFFWTIDEQVISPYFDSEEEANTWLRMMWKNETTNEND
jgi:hypothetical protein